MIFIEDYYRMTTMDENVNLMELTHLTSIVEFSLNLRPLLYIYIYFNYLIALLNVHTGEN